MKGERQQSEAFLGSERTCGEILEVCKATGVLRLQNVKQEQKHSKNVLPNR